MLGENKVEGTFFGGAESDGGLGGSLTSTLSLLVNEVTMRHVTLSFSTTNRGTSGQCEVRAPQWATGGVHAGGLVSMRASSASTTVLFTLATYTHSRSLLSSFPVAIYCEFLSSSFRCRADKAEKPLTFSQSPIHSPSKHPATMISDGELYNLAVFLGSASMVLIVAYHYFEINATDKSPIDEKIQDSKVARAS